MINKKRGEKNTDDKSQAKLVKESYQFIGQTQYMVPTHMAKANESHSGMSHMYA